MIGIFFLFLASHASPHNPKSVPFSEQNAYLERYSYPGAKLLTDWMKEISGYTLSEPTYCAIYTSAGDFPTVCKWYKEKCGFSPKSVFHAHVAYTSAATLLEDSTDQKRRRPVSVLALYDYNRLKRHIVMVVISRGDEEKLTHILLSINRLPAE